MVKINTNNPNQWKAETVPETELTTEQQDLLNRLEEAETEIDQYLEQYDEYLTDEQRAEMERLKATLKAEASAIEGGGYYDPLTGEYSDGVDYASRDSLADLGSGWNGGIISEFEEDAAKLEPEDGEYMGTIEIEASGDPMDPTKLGFSIDDAFEAEVMGEGGTIEKVEVRSQGRDLVVTAIGKDAEGNEVRKSWVIKEGTVRPEPIIFNFTAMSHAIHFVALRAYRVSDGNYNSYYGTARGFYVHGTQFDDTIYGSQGIDKIVAWEGDDFIDAGAGNDTVWGDDYYEVGGSFSENGGRDTIRGGAGNDTIYGGGNIDARYRSDNPSAANAEAAYEVENIIDDETGAIPETSSWLSTSGWTSYEEDGVVVLENDGTAGGGEINIMMPDGYTMAFASVGPDGTSIIITFVGQDAEGNPQTFQMRIEDFNRTAAVVEDVITINFTGSSVDDIVDFSKINAGSHVINISGGAGDDIILGATNDLLSQGIEYDDLVESSVSGNYLTNYAENEGVLFEDPESPSGYVAEVNPNNPKEIWIHDDGDSETEPQGTVMIAAPEGYESGYVAYDPYDNDGDPDLLLILVNPTTKDTIVIRIDGALGLEINDIIVANKIESEFDETGDYDADFHEGFGSPWQLIPISLDPAAYSLDGGAGSDLLFGPKGTTFVTDDDDEVIEGNFDEGAGLNNVPESETPTE